MLEVRVTNKRRYFFIKIDIQTNPVRPCEDYFSRVFCDIIKRGVLMGKLFTKEILLENFDYLNDLLFDNKLYLELTVYGGSIMTTDLQLKILIVY